MSSATQESEHNPDRRNRKKPIQPGQLRHRGCQNKSDHEQDQKTSKRHRLILNEGNTAGLLLQMSCSIENCFEHLLTIQLERQLLQCEGDISTGRQNRWRDLLNGNRRRRALLRFLTCSCAGIPGHGQLLNSFILVGFGSKSQHTQTTPLSWKPKDQTRRNR